jgi:hypothetical protein
VVAVAPATGLQLPPPFIETSHRTVGAGEPDAPAVKLAVAPLTTATSLGWVVIAGAAVTVSVASLVVAEPAELMKTASYSSPLSLCSAVNERVVEVAPETCVQLEPPLVETYHCTLGAGAPDAVAVKLAFAPETTLRLIGWVVIPGAAAGAATVNVAAFDVAKPAAFVKTARNCSPLSLVSAVSE